MAQRPQRPIKGFRPGKEPPQLRKRRAKEQFGDVGPAQERLIEVFAERSPQEARTLLRRWTIGLLTGAIVSAALAVLLYAWSVIATVVAGTLSLGLLFLWWRLRRQRPDLEAMADAISGTPGRRRKGG